VGEPVQGQREVVRFLSDCEEIWHRQFPGLHRRAQWHIASHLCTKGRTGAALGELSGIVKQVFLLDDATVRERIGDLVNEGLCTVEPPDSALSARTIVVPRDGLLNRFDAYLLEVSGRLLATAAALDPTLHRGPLRHIDSDSREIVLHAVECCRNDTIGGLERFFDDVGLSRARRLDARRHLLSASHWWLTLSALRHRYDRPADADGDGILADEMAASLLSLIRQNFQTTRDHIGYLLQLGILERRQGRALRVALAQAPGAQFDRVLAEAARELPRTARQLPDAVSDIESTAVIRVPSDVREPAHLLVVTRPGEPDREVPIGREPLIIGRAPDSGVVLGAIEVSRAHCRITLADGVVRATDLRSTNGTLVDGKRIDDTIVLEPDMALQIGPYRLEYRRRQDADPEATRRAEGLGSRVTVLRPPRRSRA